MEVTDSKPMIKSTLTHTDRRKTHLSQHTLTDSDIHTLQKRHGHMGSDRLKPHRGPCGGQGLAKLRIRVQGQWCVDYQAHKATAEAVQNNRFFPWLASKGCVKFLGVKKYLTESIHLIHFNII